MKTYCKGLAITRDHVMAAYETWRAGEAGRKNWKRVEREYGSAEAMVDEIYAQISSRTLAFAPIRRRERYDATCRKVRTIGIESVKQQVCDYAAVMAMSGFLDARTGFYQVANIEGKGQRMCRAVLRKWSRACRRHAKADVRKCYPSIKVGTVMRVLRKYVASDDVLYLCEALMGTYDGCLEIGSYFSLKMTQLVLSFGYHHIESLGRRRRGRWVPLVRHQLWYMDDILLVGNDRRDLARAMRSLQRYMKDEFGLELKRWKTCRTCDAEPLDMGGWRSKSGKAVLRRRLHLRAMRSFRRFERAPHIARAKRAIAYWGWLKGCDLMPMGRMARYSHIAGHARRMVSRAERGRA